ncbi:Uncharacterized protein FKW44_020828, partial [Caligus rogercresseyi]
IFDPSIFSELQPSLHCVPVAANQYLYRAGDPDDSVYVVMSGSIRVYIDDKGAGSPCIIKVAQKGEGVSSLLSFIDVLTGYPSTFRNICAKATVPVNAFLIILKRKPEHIMARVQRVILVALHQYLGLTKELMNEAFLSPKEDSYANEKENDDSNASDEPLRKFMKELNFTNMEVLREKY